MTDIDYGNRRNAASRTVLNLASLLGIAASIVLLAALGCASGNASKPENPSGLMAAAAPSKTKTPTPRGKLSGAELYSMNCNRCHQERYPTERTAAQWRTILLHMEVRANLPAEQARTILQYLQDNSGR